MLFLLSSLLILYSRYNNPTESGSDFFNSDLRVWCNKLTVIQKEQGILSITEFNKLIHDQIQNQPAPFIYERLGEKYKHFFIDEFQDTSEMQWQNLIPLIDNATSSEDLLGERGSLLIVGDPKQSIYRWRGGKAEQFIELSKDKNPFNNPEKELFPLKTNWRSLRELCSTICHFWLCFLV
jgi:ATP-dependent exoDNAse (exonuclease V) beta subunit